MTLTYRRKPYAHQESALAFADRREYYALLMQQGTGKSFVLNNDLARRWERGEISGAAIFAPNGVHTNWVRREIPKDVPEGVPYRAAAWYPESRCVPPASTRAECRQVPHPPPGNNAASSRCSPCHRRTRSRCNG